MRRRNPPSRNRRHTAGPPPWPSPAEIADCRRGLVERRGLAPGAPTDAITALRRADAWAGGVDMEAASDGAVMAWVWAWARLTDNPPRPP